MKIRLIMVLAFLLFALPAYGITFKVNWVDWSGNEDGFKIERRTGQTGMFKPIKNSPTRANVTSVIDLIPDMQEYCYRVTAFNMKGDSSHSSVGCGTPRPITLPTSPAGVTVEGCVQSGACTSSSALTAVPGITWHPVHVGCPPPAVGDPSFYIPFSSPQSHFHPTHTQSENEEIRERNK